MKLPESDILAARILIVDDQGANVRLLTRLLTEAGYTSVRATLDPLQVEALHKLHDFDLILLDLQMPVRDGFDVMVALQEADPDGYLPIIVLTAQPAHKLRALQGGAKDFISKPFDLLEVKTRIHNLLEVRLLYRRLEAHNEQLERTVQERTAALRASEARYRSLTELASDWYWEQDEHGDFTTLAGPVHHMLGLPGAGNGDDTSDDGGWHEAERAALRKAIAAREPFLDFVFSRLNHDGSQQQFRVSGEPMFSTGAKFIGYRGIGIETTPRPPQQG